MTDSNLGTIITSPLARKVIYGAYVLLGVVVGAIQVGFAAIEGAGQPEWLTVALAVYAFLSVPVGSLALVNTTAGEAPVEPSEPVLAVTQDTDFR